MQSSWLLAEYLKLDSCNILFLRFDIQSADPVGGHEQLFRLWVGMISNIVKNCQKHLISCKFVEGNDMT